MELPATAEHVSSWKGVSESKQRHAITLFCRYFTLTRPALTIWIPLSSKSFQSVQKPSWWVLVALLPISMRGVHVGFEAIPNFPSPATPSVPTRHQVFEITYQICKYSHSAQYFHFRLLNVLLSIQLASFEDSKLSSQSVVIVCAPSERPTAFTHPTIQIDSSIVVFLRINTPGLRLWKVGIFE